MLYYDVPFSSVRFCYFRLGWCVAVLCGSCWMRIAMQAADSPVYEFRMTSNARDCWFLWQNCLTRCIRPWLVHAHIGQSQTTFMIFNQPDTVFWDQHLYKSHTLPAVEWQFYLVCGFTIQVGLSIILLSYDYSCKMKIIRKLTKYLSKYTWIGIPTFLVRRVLYVSKEHSLI